MLKLSEAIALGRTLVPNPQPRNVNNCAIGMALYAINGVRWLIPSLAYQETEALYPWLLEKRKCPWCKDVILEQSATIFHVFDTHVMTDYTTATATKITFDQMIDWIRSIEPATDVAENVTTEPVQTEELVTVETA